VYRGSGTWIKPLNARTVCFILQGGGDGLVMMKLYKADELPERINITVETDRASDGVAAHSGGADVVCAPAVAGPIDSAGFLVVITEF
jgi:hypothetical protein